MRVEIEKYRGWNILFDTEKETFYVQSNEYDREETKKSFATAKKYVDDFIKENNQFIPVWVETFLGRGTRIKLIGLRKDGRFVFENEKGEKEQLSDYREKDYFLAIPENEHIYVQIEEVSTKIANLQAEKKELESKIIKKSINEIKRKYTI